MGDVVKTRRLIGILFLLFLMGLVQTPFLMADDDMARERDLTRVRKKVEALRAWQLSEVLDMDEETSSRLFPAMRQADQERWKIEARNRKLVKEMSRSLGRSNPDSQRIDRILDELRANRRELVGAEERHLVRVRQILSPEDTARYLMFQIKFQREIKQKAVDAFRDRKRSDGNPYRRDRDRYDDRGYDGGGSGGNGSGGSSDGRGKGR